MTHLLVGDRYDILASSVAADLPTLVETELRFALVRTSVLVLNLAR
jgi:hypothetical protein